MRNLGRETLVYEWIRCPNCDTVLPIERYAHVPLPDEFCFWDNGDMEAYCQRLHETDAFKRRLDQAHLRANMDNGGKVPFFTWLSTTKEGRRSVKRVEQAIMQLVTVLVHVGVRPRCIMDAHFHRFAGIFHRLVGNWARPSDEAHINGDTFIENMGVCARRLLYSLRTRELCAGSTEPKLAQDIFSDQGVMPCNPYEAMILVIAFETFEIQSEFASCMYEFASCMYEWCSPAPVHDFDRGDDDGNLWGILNTNVNNDARARLEFHVHNWTRESRHVFGSHLFTPQKCWGLRFEPISGRLYSANADSAPLIRPPTLWNLPEARATVHAKVLPLILACRHAHISNELWVLFTNEFLYVGHTFDS